MVCASEGLMHVYDHDKLIEGLLFIGAGLLVLIALLADRASPVRHLREFPLIFSLVFIGVGLLIIAPGLDPPGQISLRTTIIEWVLLPLIVIIGIYSRLCEALKRQKGDGNKGDGQM